MADNCRRQFQVNDLEWKFCILSEIPLKFAAKGPVALVQVTVGIDDKQLFEPLITKF